jgi:hypothetical protein
MVVVFVPSGGMLSRYLERETDTGVDAERIAFYQSILTVIEAVYLTFSEKLICCQSLSVKPGWR